MCKIIQKYICIFACVLSHPNMQDIDAVLLVDIHGFDTDCIHKSSGDAPQVC